jgi:hypothetical protein
MGAFEVKHGEEEGGGACERSGGSGAGRLEGNVERCGQRAAGARAIEERILAVLDTGEQARRAEQEQSVEVVRLADPLQEGGSSATQESVEVMQVSVSRRQLMADLQQRIEEAAKRRRL